MVNTGRPSPACKACRARRLKCDQTKPACIKCIKAKRICPGYREPFEVNFRDQTQSTIRKHELSIVGTKKTHASERRRDSIRSVCSASESGDSPCMSASSSPIILVSSQGLVGFSPPAACNDYNTVARMEPVPSALDLINLQTPILQQASCFFMRNFVSLTTPNSSIGGGLRFLEPLVLHAKEGSAFHSTFLAAAMASMASRPNAGELVRLARTYYHGAIKNVAKMVQDREQSRGDEVLASIIMLILYEALMWEDDATPGILNFHLKGAQAIVKLRSPEDRRTPMGQALFEFVRTFVIHQYSHSPHNSAEEIKWWVHEGSSALQKLNVEAIFLRRQLSEFLKTGKDSTHSPAAFRIYRKAKKLDKEIAKWFEETDEKQPWVRQTGVWQDDLPDSEIHLAEAYPGNIYTFSDICNGTKMLNAHVHRLMLAEVMAKIVDWVQNHCSRDVISMPQRDEAQRLAQEQIAEILAMTPCFVNWPNYKNPSPYGGMTCTFPLYITGMSTFISPKQKAFLVGRLAHIASVSGLKLAGRFAKMMESMGSRDGIYAKFKEDYLSSVRTSAATLRSPIPTGFNGHVVECP